MSNTTDYYQYVYDFTPKLFITYFTYYAYYVKYIFTLGRETLRDPYFNTSLFDWLLTFVFVYIFTFKFANKFNIGSLLLFFANLFLVLSVGIGCHVTYNQKTMSSYYLGLSDEPTDHFGN